SAPQPAATPAIPVNAIPQLVVSATPTTQPMATPSIAVNPIPQPVLSSAPQPAATPAIPVNAIPQPVVNATPKTTITPEYKEFTGKTVTGTPGTKTGQALPPAKSGEYTIVVRKDGQPDVRDPDQLQSGDRILGHADTRNNADLQKDAFTSKYSNADLWAMSGDANDDPNVTRQSAPAPTYAPSTAQNYSSIETNTSRIASNSDAIDKNTANIANNKKEIDGLRSDLEAQAKKIDGSMAQAGAFAGLVSPYGVGKINMTAAVGHSGDANAIAIGSGYRINESLTVKLGGAYDTGSEQVTSYAGVGYEF
ncbi:YadA C-terminal domain-containing protein, partial [Vibrio crassostreae]